MWVTLIATPIQLKLSKSPSTLMFSCLSTQFLFLIPTCGGVAKRCSVWMMSRCASAQQAAAAGVSRLFAVGPLSRAACDVFEKDALHFESSSDLADAVDNELQAAVTTPTILVKASRAMALDRVVQRLSRMGAEPC